MSDLRLHAANLSTTLSLPTIIAATNDLPTSVLSTIALVLLTLYCWPVWTRHLYPPGPWPLPFIGHMPWLVFSKNPEEWQAGLRKKYGDVITCDIGMKQKLVILNSADAIYEGFVKQADFLSTRPPSIFMPVINGKGLVNEADGKWQELRRFSLSIFREHGIGSKGIEPVITEELQYFLSAMQHTDGEPFDPENLLTQGVSNVITHVVFGDRFEYSDEKLANLQFKDFVGAAMKNQIVPILKYLPGDPIGYRSGLKDFEKSLQFAKDQIEKHKEEINYDNPPRDFVDAFLVKMKEEEGNPDTPFTVVNFLTTVMQFYIAGTDTTSSQLYWCYLYAGLYPEVQEKIYLEIKQTVGERPVTYADRNSMPYTTAVLTEIQRQRNVALGTLLHYTSSDIKVLGVNIPKGTTVRGNIMAALHDENVYPEPDKFKPERFFNKDGKFVKPDSKHAVNFGTGRRVCLGEHLARAELFMFFVATLQKFEIRLPEGQKISEKGCQKFTFSPEENYKMTCTPRE